MTSHGKRLVVRLIAKQSFESYCWQVTISERSSTELMPEVLFLFAPTPLARCKQKGYPKCQSADKLHELILFSGPMSDSNRRPSECKSDALPTELMARKFVDVLKNPGCFLLQPGFPSNINLQGNHRCNPIAAQQPVYAANRRSAGANLLLRSSLMFCECCIILFLVRDTAECGIS